MAITSKAIVVIGTTEKYFDLIRSGRYLIKKSDSIIQPLIIKFIN